MSAKDIARLTRHLLRDHPQVIQTISLPEYIFRQGEKRELILSQLQPNVTGFISLL